MRQVAVVPTWFSPILAPRPELGLRGAERGHAKTMPALVVVLTRRRALLPVKLRESNRVPTRNRCDRPFQTCCAIVAQLVGTARYGVATVMRPLVLVAVG